MPRGIKRRAKAKIEWSASHRRQLLSGHEFFGDGFGRGESLDLEAAREAWGDLREEMLPEFIREHPFTRPWAWWRFDAPQPRKQRIDDEDASVRVLGPVDWFGCPSHFSAPPPEGMFESERDYLTRLDLFTVEERELIRRERHRRANP